MRWADGYGGVVEGGFGSDGTLRTVTFDDQPFRARKGKSVFEAEEPLTIEKSNGMGSVWARYCAGLTGGSVVFGADWGGENAHGR